MLSELQCITSSKKYIIYHAIRSAAAHSFKCCFPVQSERNLKYRSFNCTQGLSV